MISESEATDIAMRFIRREAAAVEGGVVIISEKTIRKPYGWIFFYNARLHLETGDPLAALGGNGPLVVERESGRVHVLSTVEDVAAAIGAFEKATGLARPGDV